MSDQSFFDKFGLEVNEGAVEVGKSYPLYGMITKFISEDEESVIVELNFSIEATLNVKDETKRNLLKERSFEPGIFVSTIISVDNIIKVDCSTVVFGKRQNELRQ